MGKFFSITTMLPVLVLITSFAWSEVERVEMRVDGLACPFCAYGLEKKLKEVGGVSEIEIRVDDGVVVLESVEGQSIAVERLEPAVEDAGFTARGITATAVGKIATVRDRIVLRVRNTDTEFLLADDTALQDLWDGSAESKPVRLTGSLEERTPKGDLAHRFTMTVEKSELLDSGTE